ncbi:MAG: uroporphyrinogen decarboxylase family protein, partial [Candidatus Latescibacterota bacterium]
MTVPRTRREAVPFTWSASTGMHAYGKLAGISQERLFLDAEGIAEAYRVGRPLAEEAYGPEVGMGGPGWLGISYGHVNTLGCPLIFPEDSEVAHRPAHASLEEGIAALKREIDFTREGRFPFYLRLWEELKHRLPGERIPFGGFGSEGPVTSAWSLRGHGFFTDLFDAPELVRQYLTLITRSIAAYNGLVRRLNGAPEFSPDGVSLADDVAAMVPPRLWPELVVPSLEEFYRLQTSGPRHAHIEDLTISQLPFLDRIGLDSFDPSVSPRLTPALLRDHCSVPFSWRLNSTQYPDLSCEDNTRWVYRAAAEGASSVWTYAWWPFCPPEKVRAFIEAGKQVKRL